MTGTPDSLAPVSPSRSVTLRFWRRQEMYQPVWTKPTVSATCEPRRFGNRCPSPN